YQNQLFVCRELGKYAEAKGVTFAIETGPEKADRLRSFLDDVASKGIGVNLDPANLIMVQNDDPVKAVYTLKDYIVHTHAKDGVQYKPCDPVKVYASFAEGGIEGLNIGELFNELPLGEGKVDWDRYLAALSEVGYRGYLTVEREVGANPEADIRTAVNFLKSKI
ncbi:MAG: sugar phosphate isomerase/epimerase, partial [Victivallales bacterium]|nr:sugar phosphate isomerase/epimerase [Victivallales bacterium]